MNEDPELRLHEEVLLLALKDDKGTPHVDHYGFALGGAILAELLGEDRVGLAVKKAGIHSGSTTSPTTS